MPAQQTAPVTQLRTRLKAIIEDEFGNTLPVKMGRLHEAHPGPAAGIYPLTEVEGRQVLVQDTAAAVQVFLPWAPPRGQVRPDFVADPAVLEEYAERLREAVYGGTHPINATRGVWDLRLTRVDYQPDPTGQITRFTATVVAIGENFAETDAA